MKGLGAVAFVASGIGLIASFQQGLHERVASVKRRDDVVLLPPPKVLRLMSLGYTSAGADLVWVKLLIEYGLHWAEKRAFPDASRYIDGVITLEPTHEGIYVYADTFLLSQPVAGTYEDALRVRAYYEQGLQQRPNDAELWKRYGQYLAFRGKEWLKSDAERQQWRLDGARAISRAADLGGAVDNGTMVAGQILGESGEREAAIAHYQRAYALADDDTQRDDIARHLRQLNASAFSAALEHSKVAFLRYGREEAPYLPPTSLLLLGPFRDVGACTGLAATNQLECQPGWAPLLEYRSRGYD